ncbi:MAG: alpha/beta hydrolase [Candidatus Protistobacter heckmanni]|nr:alpha/beta hydrolase [Candidatus Protistobacter heckmanni]
MVGDVDCMLEHAAARHPGLPKILFGHSMGSFISRAYFLARGAKLDGLILSATGYRQKSLAYAMRGIARAKPSPLMASLVFGSFNLGFLPAATPVDWLLRDKAEVAKYVADLLCGFAPAPAL